MIPRKKPSEIDLAQQLSTGGMANIPQSVTLDLSLPSIKPAVHQEESTPPTGSATPSAVVPAEQPKSVSAPAGEESSPAGSSAEGKPESSDAAGKKPAKNSPQAKSAKPDKQPSGNGADPDIEYLYLHQLIDAPKEMNEWSVRPENVLIDYALSIADTGLIHPLTVWEQPDGKYMILSGHNRKRAYQLLTTKFADIKDSNGMYFSDKYQTIRCSVYPYKSLDVNKAKRIINDANSNQRYGLTSEEKIRIAEQKLAIIRQMPKDSVIEKIGETFSLKRSFSYDLVRIAHLPAELGSLYANGTIGRQGALRLASLPKEQCAMLAKNPEKIVPSQISQINPKCHYKDSELTALLYATPAEPTTRVSFTVPCRLQAEFKERVTALLAEMEKGKKGK